MDITSSKLIKDAESLTVHMFEFVNKTQMVCEDDICLNICGVIRDSAYKIQRIIQLEDARLEKITEK